MTAGLVTERDTHSTHGVSSVGKAANANLMYELTDEGRKYYKTDAVKTFNGNSIGGFCLGKASVKEIGQFTEPSDILGTRISCVNYTYSVSDLPAWETSLEQSAALREPKTGAMSQAEPLKRLDIEKLFNKSSYRY